jgi:formylglycine-generating enzyme required for sulfatase activity
MAKDLPTVGITRTSSSGAFSYAVKGNGNVPVFDVSWGDTARFVNWLANGEPTASEGTATTENGTYSLNGGTSNAALMLVSRNPGSTWVLPTVNEWYKSAYYSGGGTASAYWTYATQSGNTPSNVLSATGTNNANFSSDVVEPPNYGLTDPVNYLTSVGAFADSPSTYGTFDQNGDVYEWNETAYGGTARGFGGGGWGSGFVALSSGGISETNPTYDGSEDGFRVAYVPEPGSLCLLVLAAVSLSTISFFRFSRRSRSCQNCKAF